jgi:hypothetical protein
MKHFIIPLIKGTLQANVIIIISVSHCEIQWSCVASREAVISSSRTTVCWYTGKMIQHIWEWNSQVMKLLTKLCECWTDLQNQLAWDVKWHVHISDVNRRWSLFIGMAFLDLWTNMESIAETCQFDSSAFVVNAISLLFTFSVTQCNFVSLWSVQCLTLVWNESVSGERHGYISIYHDYFCTHFSRKA